MAKKQVKAKIVYRKLGNEWAWGQAWVGPGRPLIEIDPRLGARKHLEVICHESLHVAMPELTDYPTKSREYKRGEARIDRIGKIVSEVLWRDGYRKVLLPKHKIPVKITKNRPQGKQKTKK